MSSQQVRDAKKVQAVKVESVRSAVIDAAMALVYDIGCSPERCKTVIAFDVLAEAVAEYAALDSAAMECWVAFDPDNKNDYGDALEEVAEKADEYIRRTEGNDMDTLTGRIQTMLFFQKLRQAVEKYRAMKKGKSNDD